MKNKIWEKRFREERKKTSQASSIKLQERVHYLEKYNKFLIDKLAEYSKWMKEKHEFSYGTSERATGAFEECQEAFERIFEQKKEKENESKGTNC